MLISYSYVSLKIEHPLPSQAHGSAKNIYMCHCDQVYWFLDIEGTAFLILHHPLETRDAEYYALFNGLCRLSGAVCSVLRKGCDAPLDKRSVSG